VNRFAKLSYLLVHKGGKVEFRTRGDAAARRVVERTELAPRIQLYRCDGRGRVYLGTYMQQRWTLLRSLSEETDDDL